MKFFYKKVILPLIIAIICGNIAGTAAIIDNNGINIPNWNMLIKDSKGYGELVSDVVHSGENAFHLVKTSPKDGAYKYIKLNNSASIENGKTYAYGCYIKADKALQINMFFTDNGMENLSALGHTWDWKKVEFKVTATRDNAGQEMGFMCYGSARNIWIDDVFVYEVDDEGNYVGDNRIAGNAGFEGSSVASNNAAQKDDRVFYREKKAESAEDFLSYSKELPMVYNENIKIDGDLSDWKDFLAVDFLRYYRTNGYKGECANTATLKTAFDNNNFYFLVETVDPVHCDTGLYYWSSDSLQFMLTSKENVFGEEISIQYITDGNPFCTNDNITYSTGRNGEVTYYEVAVPWGTYIPEKPGKFWFNAAVNNNDGADRIYCVEIDEGIVSSKHARKAKAMIPMYEGEKTLEYLSADKENVMLNDDELETELTIINLGEAREAEVVVGGASEKVKLPANNYVKRKYSFNNHIFGNNTVKTEIRYADKAVTEEYTYMALPDNLTVQKYCDSFSQKIADIEEAASKLNEKGITTDYENIELKMAERSVEVIKRLQAQGDFDVVVYNIGALEKILKSVEDRIEAYKNGTKTPQPIPKLDSGKVILNGNSFYGKTVTAGKEEYRPVYLASMNMGWEDRDEMPVWRDFGFNTFVTSISFGDVVSQAEMPGVWKKQRGTIDYADADITVTDEEAKTGNYSVKFVNRTASKTGYGTYLYQTFKPEPKTKYTLTFSAKGNLNGMKVGFGSNMTLSGINDKWKDYSVSWTSGDSPASTNVIVLTGDITDGAYIDNMKLVKEGSSKNMLSNESFEEYYKRWENTSLGVNEKSVERACDILRRAEFYNVKVIMSMTIHDPNSYIYTLENARDEGKNYGSFMKTNPTAPSVTEALRIFYRAVIPKITEYDSLAALQTHNEPTFNTSDSTYYKPFYTKFLVDKYGTVQALNEVYGSEYNNFEEVEMPQKKELSVYFYDWQVFNESVLTDYFKIVAEEMAALAPGLPYSAKYMAETSPTISDNTLKWGINFEHIAPYITIAANDAFAYLGNGTVQTKLAWYDIQNSVKGTAVCDWEDHIIIDHKKIDLDPRQYNWLLTNVWQGAIHYLASDNVWIWGINDTTSNGDFRNTTMQYRADCMNVIGRTMSDINRLSYEIRALKDKPSDVGLFYSHASRTLDASHASAFYESYCNTLYNGYKPHILTESNFDDVYDYKLVVVPEAYHASLDTVKKVIDFAKKGGKVILIGDNCLKYDINNSLHSESILNELYSLSAVIPTDTQPGEKKTAIAPQLFGLLGEAYDGVLNPHYSLVDTATGEKVKNTEWLAVEYEGDVLLNILNYDWNYSPDLQLVYEGKALNGVSLITGESVYGPIKAEPYTPIFLRLKK